jgi:hypothetical protein
LWLSLHVGVLCSGSLVFKCVSSLCPLWPPVAQTQTHSSPGRGTCYCLVPYQGRWRLRGAHHQAAKPARETTTATSDPHARPTPLPSSRSTPQTNTDSQAALTCRLVPSALSKGATLLPSVLLYKHSHQTRKAHTSHEAANTTACCVHAQQQPGQPVLLLQLNTRT